jgi:UDP-N-acetylglucosamine 2-epimerase (non-hydrolysing)
VLAGTAKLVGTGESDILSAGRELLGDPACYRAMAQAVSPYGDGRAAERIRFHVLDSLGIESEAVPAWT